MDEQLTNVLSDIERRLTAIEARLAEERPLKGSDRGPQGIVGGFVGAPIAVAVFAFLSGTSAAWIATAAIGVASIIAAAVVLSRAP